MRRALLVLVSACAHPAPAPVVANTAPPAPPIVATCTGETCLPRLAYIDTTGRAHEVAGRVVLVNFFATWAHPSAKELPNLARAFERYRERVAFLGILTDQPDDQDLVAYLAAHPVPYPIVRATPEILTAYRYPDAIPTTFVYDRAGRQRAHHVGALDDAQLDALLDDALQSR